MASDKLPQFNTSDPALSLLQTSWARVLNPIVAQPQNNAVILKDVNLVTGTNTINHKLGRELQGWQVIQQSGRSDIYDLQRVNKIPDLTLVLVASSGITVDLMCF